MVVSMERWVNKVAVVTGASSGIGAAIAEHLVNAGVTVVGLARRKDRIEALAKRLVGKPGTLYAFETDISKEKDILKAFQWIKNNVGPDHILVNNAGVFKGTNLTEGLTHLWKETFDVNVLGLCIATREAIKDMRANKVDGHIIHINSTDGHKCPDVPNCNVYPASKHAVTALTETLRQELNFIKSKIKITSVSPGGVPTEIVQAAGEAKSKELEEYFENAPVLDPEDIADAVIYTLATPPHLQVHEITVKSVGEMV